MIDKKEIPIIQVVGYKNSGKTTLVTKLTQILSKEGINIATIKHHGHGGEPREYPNTDTFLHKEAGATLTSVKGERNWLISYSGEKEITLTDMITMYKNFPIDLILVEGFKEATYSKIIMLRTESDYPLLEELDHIIAIGGLDRPKTDENYFSFSMNEWEVFEREILELLRSECNL